MEIVLWNSSGVRQDLAKRDDGRWRKAVVSYDVQGLDSGVLVVIYTKRALNSEVGEVCLWVDRWSKQM